MSIPPFSISWDYRCPFARNAHEHVLTALRAGADWDVEFVPFSLSQVHVAEGDPPVWEDPAKAPELLALEVGIVVRDKFKDEFFDIHEALFAARHDEGKDIRDEAVLREVLAKGGVDDEAVFTEIRAGWPLAALREAHETEVAGRKTFGVPTFVAGDQAVFVRLMHRPRGDGEQARTTIERVVELVAGAPELNEFKHTTIPH